MTQINETPFVDYVELDFSNMALATLQKVALDNIKEYNERWPIVWEQAAQIADSAALLNAITPAKIEAELKALTVNGMPVPRAFGWVGNGFRGGRTQQELEAQWANLPLQERVALTACLMGPNKNSLINKAYLALCKGQTLDEFCANIVKL